MTASAIDGASGFSSTARLISASTDVGPKRIEIDGHGSVADDHVADAAGASILDGA
jgi:hypothetical protein